MRFQSISGLFVGFVAVLGSLCASAEEVTVTGYNQVLELECNSADLIVEGLEHQVDVTGPCQSVTVSGLQNVLVFDSAGQVTFSGANNQTTGAIVGAGPMGEPDVAFAGVDNVLTLRFDRAAVVEMSGSGNRLFWSTGAGVPAPQVRIIGENNTAQQQ